MPKVPAQPDRPVTIRDIAAAANVHHATVSRALRNDGRISEPMRARIQALARQAGYRPNPLVAAFTAQVRSYRSAPRGAAIALLQSYDSERHEVWQAPYFEGLRSRAAQLGYRVERIRFQEVDETPKRLAEVLRTRGIRGLVVLPVPSAVTLDSLDCQGLALAAIGYSLKAPSIHRVAADYFQNMTLALRTLERRGYRRIGFGMAEVDLERFGERWLGGHGVWQRTVPRGQRVPVHLNAHLQMPEPHGSHGAAAEWSDSALRDYGAWLDRYRPDVVVGSSGAFYRGLRLLGSRMQARVRATGYAALGVLPDLPQVGGIDQDQFAIGAAAVDLVVGQLHRNEYGLPLHPATMLIQGRWVEGATIRTP